MKLRIETNRVWIPTFLMFFCNRDQQPTEGDLSRNTIEITWLAELHSGAETRVRDESPMGMKKGLGTFWCCVHPSCGITHLVR